MLVLPVQPQQPVTQAIQPSTGNQLYRQPKHRQPVIQAAQAQATSDTRSASTALISTYCVRDHASTTTTTTNTLLATGGASTALGPELKV